MMEGKGMGKEKMEVNRGKACGTKLPGDIFMDMMSDEPSKLGNTECSDRDKIANNI